MSKISLAFSGLVNNIINNKTILFTQVYSSFNKIPDTILNSHQKLICQSFMMMAYAAGVMRDAKYQLPMAGIGAMNGLTRTQVQRAIKYLPKACDEVMKKKLLGHNEKIYFRIMDENGKAIDKNNSGNPSYYFFKYQSPSVKMQIDGSFFKDKAPEEKKTKKVAPPAKVNSKYNPDEDPQFDTKWFHLQRMNFYYSDAELKQFLQYDLNRIIMVVDYFLKERAKKVLSIGWLKKAFTEYELNWDKVRETMLKQGQFLSDLHNAVKEIIEKENIITTFIFEHKKKPLHHISQYNWPQQFQEEYFKYFDKLSEEQKTHLEEISEILYGFLKERFKKVNVDSFKTAAIHIKRAIVIKHFNIV